MYCTKCGVQANEDFDYCVDCGSILLTPNHDSVPVPAKKSYGAIIGTLFASIIVIAAVFFVVSFINRVGPLITAQRSLGNFNNEVVTRLQTSPLHVFELLGNNLADGTTTVSFDYSNTWSERFMGDITFMADSSQHAVLTDINLNFGGLINFDLEFLMNRQYAMARTRLLGRDFYGITFATFREDFQPFGTEMGLGQQTINDIADFVESLEESLNMDDSSDISTEYFTPYIEVITAFARNTEYTSSREDGITRIEFLFTGSDIVQLLRDLLVVFEDDENMRDWFESFDQVRFRDIVRDIRRGINEIEDNLSGEITLTLYVGSRNRLNRIQFNADLTFDGERAEIDIALDLGSSVLDDWTLDIAVTESGETETLSVAWEINESNDRYINTFTLRPPGSADAIQLSSDWSPSTGAFTLSYSDNAPRGESGAVSGIFSVDNYGGFRLGFDAFGSGRASFVIEIESSAASNIQFPADFINICQWNEQLLYDLEQALDDLF